MLLDLFPMLEAPAIGTTIGVLDAARAKQVAYSAPAGFILFPISNHGLAPWAL
jgi:hypothetical protein